jgi:flavin reductase (DIM6/NTAB) family NADH-FMN oxidoreductase RutF
MTYQRKDIDAMDSRFRAAFVNSLPGHKPANLIGTVSADGLSNLAIVSSVVHIGSYPPLLAFISRPLSVERHTLGNILETGVYTVNAVPESLIHQAHQTAARYEREVSEFDAAGIMPCFADGFAAPFAAESELSIGLQFVSQIELPNDTVMVVGEIIRVDVAEEAVLKDGSLDFSRIDAVSVTGLDTYYRHRKAARMAYAKPDLPPRKILSVPHLDN